MKVVYDFKTSGRGFMQFYEEMFLSVFYKATKISNIIVAVFFAAAGVVFVAFVTEYMTSKMSVVILEKNIM